jgi:four helix bundle protein
MADFKQLAVWQRSHQFALEIYRVTSSFPAAQRFTLTAQLQRAAVSVSSNIAEGCGRSGDAEFCRFLRIARGSANEIECQLLLARDLGFLPRDEWARLDSVCQLLSAMLLKLTNALQE